MIATACDNDGTKELGEPCDDGNGCTFNEMLADDVEERTGVFATERMGDHPPDLGGDATTEDATRAVLQNL